MYAAGEGGKKDKKKAAELWRTAESGGDPYASILLADQMFLEISGGKPPGPGKFKFRGDIPVSDIELAMSWYKDAQKRDARPETQARAKMALYVLGTFKAAAQGVAAGAAVR
jgi:TPR repeat protein